MIFKDIVSQSSDVFETLYDYKYTIFGFVSPGSAETLITRGGGNKSPCDSMLA